MKGNPAEAFHHIISHQICASAGFLFDGFQLKSFNCLAVFIITVPQIIASRFYLHGILPHAHKQSQIFCLFALHTASIQFGMSVSPDIIPISDDITDSSLHIIDRL